MDKNMKEEMPFSRVDQVGVVVRDMDRAIQYYGALGIGPFESLQKPPIKERTVHGRPANDVKILSKRAKMGTVELELVQPVSGASIQKEFLEERGEGINHLGFFVDDLDKEIAKLVARGFKVISSVKRADGTGSAYFDADKIGGVLFELVQRVNKA